ncbi:MAG: hypothetical protein Q8859_14250, partial [Bacteroidota bacterium]|nr:hypothetical protein [Bacteroidota bacterium]
MSTNALKLAPKLGLNPLFFVDNVKIKKGDLKNLEIKSIAAVTILTEKSATDVYGNEGSDGVVLVKTKTFARKIYT